MTVPYAAGFPQWDDETTVTIDPAEMRLTAEAMMFVDTGIVELPEIKDKKRPAPIAKPTAIAKPTPIRNRRAGGAKRRTREAT